MYYRITNKNVEEKYRITCVRACINERRIIFISIVCFHNDVSRARN